MLGAALGAFATVAQPASHGKSIYGQTCVACHGKDGKGAFPGVPALGGKKGVLLKPDSELIKNIMNGYQTPGSPMAMPPKGGNPSLNEEDVAAVLQFMRETYAP
jgi:mono/diheme cytochrome c family protein